MLQFLLIFNALIILFFIKNVYCFITLKSSQLYKQSLNPYKFNKLNRIQYRNNIKMNIYKNSLNEVIDMMKDNTGYLALSTIDKSNTKHKIELYPFLSICGFSVTKTGIPYFCLSKISKHTQNININNHASILITDLSNKKNIASSKRVTFSGKINKLVPNNKSENSAYIYEIAKYREDYLKKHPGALWVDFPDFEFYRMDLIKDIYYIGGFKKATKISVKKYFQKFI